MNAELVLLRGAARAAVLLNRLLPLGLAERRYLNRFEGRTAPPPLFILGPPRSGTTILYQLLANRYRAAYLCNLDALFPRAPALSDRLFTRRGKQDLLDKGSRSCYGYVSGAFSPSEAGAVHRYWFAESESPARTRAAIWALSLGTGAPFLAKNTLNVFRLKAIVRSCPDACFLWMRRDRAAVMRSLLRWRSEKGLDWAGVRPPGYRRWLHLTPEVQVSHQLDAVEGALTDYERAAGERLLEVTYEELGRDVPESLDRIAAWYLATTGYALEPSGWNPPARLSIAHRRENGAT